LHAIPADGIKRIVVSHRTQEDRTNIVRGVWFYDDADNVLMELNDSYSAAEKDTITETELTLNDGERVIGVRGDTSNISVESSYLGYWRDLEFLVSDGVVDRVLEVGNEIKA